MYFIDFQSKCFLNKVYQYDMMITMLNCKRNVVWWFFCVDLANRLYNEPGLFCLILYRLTAFILGLERIVARIQKQRMKNMESWCKSNWTLSMKKVENSMADSSDMEIQINASIESWITRTSYRNIICWPTRSKDN